MKRSRIMKIKEIIQNQVIETQEELAEALRKEGINVTQATFSISMPPDSEPIMTMPAGQDSL